MVQHSSTNGEFVAAIQETNRYVSGHIPFSGVAHLEFDRRITILREPLHVLASIIAFAEETGYFNDELRLAKTQNNGVYNVYSVYFSPSFDFFRYMIDRRYGIAPGYQSYIKAAHVGPAIDALRNFDYVLDFNSLDLQIKRLICREGLFPPSTLYKRRAYRYEPNLQQAMTFLSEFDSDFYQQAALLFVHGFSDADYEVYRASYCVRSGISLREQESFELDLAGPIGAGWNDAELSELNTVFRWSEDAQPVIDIPLADAGSYSVFVYLNDPNQLMPNASASVVIRGGEVTITRTAPPDMVIFEFQFTTRGADWLRCELNVSQDSMGDLADTGDDREIGVILGAVYVRRTG
ncbi:MAG: hypothetical protein AB7I22_20290 [Ramlibacter sp.]